MTRAPGRLHPVGDPDVGGGTPEREARPEVDIEVDVDVDQESVARSIALRLLTAAPRSRAQLAEAMARRDVPQDVASAVLDRFTEVGLLNDAEYARMLVRSRHEDRGLARRALGEELRRKGIAPDLALDALAGLDTETERGTAGRLVARKLAGTVGLDRQVRVRRTLAALGRKGYPPGLVMEQIREYLAAEESTAGDHIAPDEGSLLDLIEDD